MRATIDEVLKTLETVYTIKADGSNKGMYAGFLERQEKRHGEYFEEYKDENVAKTYIDILADELFIFSVLVRETPVTIDRHKNIKSLLDNRDKLRALKQQGSDWDMWEEVSLFGINQRRKSARKNHPEMEPPKYSEVIDEVGQDKEVVKIWGNKPIVYQTDVKFNKSSGGYLGTKNSR